MPPSAGGGDEDMGEILADAVAGRSGLLGGGLDLGGLGVEAHAGVDAAGEPVQPVDLAALAVQASASAWIAGPRRGERRRAQEDFGRQSRAADPGRCRPVLGQHPAGDGDGELRDRADRRRACG